MPREGALNLGLPQRPAKGQQVECNAPLSSATVRVDKSSSPSADAWDPYAATAAEAARLEQLRAFQLDLEERVRRQNQARAKLRRAQSAGLEEARAQGRERVRSVASHATEELARALRASINRSRKVTKAHSAAAGAAAAGGEVTAPKGKLFDVAHEMVAALRGARERMRADAAGARGDGGRREGTGELGAGLAEGAVVEEEVADAGGEEAAEETGDEEEHTPPAAGAAGASAEEKATAEVSSANAHAATSAGAKGAGVSQSAKAARDQSAVLQGQPRDSAPRRSRAAARTRGEQLDALASVRVGGNPADVPISGSPKGGFQHGRTPEALAVFASVRREQLAVERAHARALADARREAEAARAQEEAAARSEAARLAAEAKAAEAEAVDGREEDAAAAREHAAKLERRALRDRQEQQAARYSEALRSTLKARLDSLSKPLPPLCACGEEQVPRRRRCALP